MIKNCSTKLINQRNSGFTLVELLVVISIISILAGATYMIINPLKMQGNARNAGRASDLRQLASALERYYVKNGSYPVTVGGWCSDIGSVYGANCGGTGDWIPGLIAAGEINKLPQDPRYGEVYPPCNKAINVAYLYQSNGTDYKLLDYCGPENISATDKLLDPKRTTSAWAVWSSDTSKMW